MSKSDAILTFWFGNAITDIADLPAQQKLWWEKRDQTDAAITQQFGDDVDRASQGKYADWKQSPKGRLALIILLDQFTRNIYRNTPRAFAHDSQALPLALEGIDQGQDQALSPLERVFFYMPLEHSENKTIQAQCLQCFVDLRDSAPDNLKAAMQGFYDYAKAHFDIIERFDRFPHRNRILGRPSTPEEQTYLQQPGSGF